MVPQWRRFTSAMQSSELAMPPRQKDTDAEPPIEPDLIKRIENFRRRPCLIAAADLVKSAVVLGRDAEAVRAARVLLRHDDTVPLVRIQAERLMWRTGHGDELQRENPNSASHGGVATRVRTRINPEDAIAWVELALVQFCRGHVQHAERSIAIALHLAPNNRHVLRSAARLFFQVRDFERAHDLIRRNESTLGDPWLMAAEVALSGFAERRSTFMKQGLVLANQRALLHLRSVNLPGRSAHNY